MNITPNDVPTKTPDDTPRQASGFSFLRLLGVIPVITLILFFIIPKSYHHIIMLALGFIYCSLMMLFVFFALIACLVNLTRKFIATKSKKDKALPNLSDPIFLHSIILIPVLIPIFIYLITLTSRIGTLLTGELGK